jgi:hypothetical protein
MAVTSTMAPIRRRLARSLSWSSSSLIARAIDLYRRHSVLRIGQEFVGFRSDKLLRQNRLQENSGI